MTKFLSLCSGIEAASVAFQALGWEATAFCEIDPFPCAVLAHHFPHVPNLGDMTNFRDWPDEIFIESELIVGGPPCQAFSVAGRREGLNDERGNLTLLYAELIDHADKLRARAGREPVIALYENVPGIFTDRTNAFGCFLGSLAGEDCALVAPGKRWTNVGVVLGPQRAIAWRTIDAQYFGVAQRRRRVFVVASARTRFDPAAILLECEGVRRDIAPSREAGAGVARSLTNSTGGASAKEQQFTFVGDNGHALNALNDGVQAFGGNNTRGPIEVATAVRAKGGTGHGDFESETFLVEAMAFESRFARNGRGAPDIVVPPLKAQSGETGKGDGARLVVYPILEVGKRTGRTGHEGKDGLGLGKPDDPMFTLQANAQHAVAFKPSYFTRGKDGAPSEVYPPLSADADKGDQDPLICFNSKDHGQDAAEEISPTLRAAPHSESHDNGGAPPAVAQAMQVRRLTPRECERLMGFPDDFTQVVHRNKPAADGPRYRALGNSWAVPCPAWIGRRIWNWLVLEQ